MIERTLVSLLGKRESEHTIIARTRSFFFYLLYLPIATIIPMFRMPLLAVSIPFLLVAIVALAVVEIRSLVQDFLLSSATPRVPDLRLSERGKKIVLWLPKAEREYILGDLEEEAREHEEQYGPRFAWIWYRWQIILTGAKMRIWSRLLKLGALFSLGNG